MRTWKWLAVMSALVAMVSLCGNPWLPVEALAREFEREVRFVGISKNVFKENAGTAINARHIFSQKINLPFGRDDRRKSINNNLEGLARMDGDGRLRTIRFFVPVPIPRPLPDHKGARNASVERRGLPIILDSHSKGNWLAGFDGSISYLKSQVCPHLCLADLSGHNDRIVRRSNGFAGGGQRVAEKDNRPKANPGGEHAEPRHQPLRKRVFREKPSVKWADPKTGIIWVLILLGTMGIVGVAIAGALSWVAEPRERPNEKEKGDRNPGD